MNTNSENTKVGKIFQEISIAAMAGVIKFRKPIMDIGKKLITKR